MFMTCEFFVCGLVIDFHMHIYEDYTLQNITLHVTTHRFVYLYPLFQSRLNLEFNHLVFIHPEPLKNIKRAKKTKLTLKNKKAKALKGTQTMKSFLLCIQRQHHTIKI